MGNIFEGKYVNQKNRKGGQGKILNKDISAKIVKGAIERYIEKLKVAEKLATKSNFTLEDADELGEKVKQEMWERHKYYLKTLKE